MSYSPGWYVSDVRRHPHRWITHTHTADKHRYKCIKATAAPFFTYRWTFETFFCSRSAHLKSLIYVCGLSVRGWPPLPIVWWHRGRIAPPLVLVHRICKTVNKHSLVNCLQLFLFHLIFVRFQLEEPGPFKWSFSAIRCRGFIVLWFDIYQTRYCVNDLISLPISLFWYMASTALESIEY